MLRGIILIECLCRWSRLVRSLPGSVGFSGMVRPITYIRCNITDNLIQLLRTSLNKYIGLRRD